MSFIVVVVLSTLVCVSDTFPQVENGVIPPQEDQPKPEYDPCAPCVCENNQWVCNRRDCMRPPCENPEVIPGACCPVCPKGNLSISKLNLEMEKNILILKDRLIDNSSTNAYNHTHSGNRVKKLMVRQLCLVTPM
ncbi:hypothetical protein Btru_074639 [Bulinus truncatus]|nr:hypothetical protein Btru_074639 [Bulinus truncatus]